MKVILSMPRYRKNFSIVFSMLIVLFVTSDIAFSQTRNAGTAITAGQGGGVQQQGIDLSAGSSDNIERDFNSGFVGGSDNTGRFIGNESAAQQSFNRQAVPNFQRAQRNQANQSKRSKASPIRFRAKIGFQFPQRKSAAFNDRINAELVRLKKLKPQYASVRLIQHDNGVLVLSGSVPTKRDRRLIEFFVCLEPGVNSVRNELRVPQSLPIR